MSRMKTKQELYTWENISKAESGTVFLDEFDEGVRFFIMKGGSALCVYVGIPIDHPLAGFGYDDLPLECHGGLTFSGAGHKSKEGGSIWPEGFWWYGWDYAHAGDYCDFYDTSLSKGSILRQDKKWLVEMVKEDSWSAIYNFKILMKLAEKIQNKKP